MVDFYGTVNVAGWCSTLTMLLICSSFRRENGYPLLICSSLSTAQVGKYTPYMDPSWEMQEKTLQQTNVWNDAKNQDRNQ